MFNNQNQEAIVLKTKIAFNQNTSNMVQNQIQVADTQFVKDECYLQIKRIFFSMIKKSKQARKLMNKV